MDVLGRNIFWAFFSELLFVILAIVLKEDKQKVVTVLIIGTLISGVIGFGGSIVSKLTSASIFLPNPANSSSPQNPNNNTVNQVDNSISIEELKNITFNDQSYRGNAYFDVTLKNNAGAKHSVGIRFWYQEIRDYGNTWIVFDRVIENVSGLSNTTSRIVFEPGNSDASGLSGDQLQAVVTSIDNQIIYNSDSVFNAISLDLVSSTHEQNVNFVTLTCIFNITNRLPVPLQANDGGNYNFSYMNQGQQVYESYGSDSTPRWDSENIWGYGESSIGFFTIPPSSNAQIVLTIGKSLEEYVLKSMEINEVTIAIYEESVVEWVRISHTYRVSGCVWTN